MSGGADRWVRTDHADKPTRTPSGFGDCRVHRDVPERYTGPRPEAGKRQRVPGATAVAAEDEDVGVDRRSDAAQLADARVLSHRRRQPGAGWTRGGPADATIPESAMSPTTTKPRPGNADPQRRSPGQRHERQEWTLGNETVLMPLSLWGQIV
jgi:hypothetical protein